MSATLSRSPQKERLAESRRKNFKQFMSRHDLCPAEWARLAGMPNPNALYNFLAGRSGGLSLDTLRRLADALPGVNVGDIFNDKTLAVNENDRRNYRLGAVQVKSIARAGLWRRMYEIPTADQSELTVVIPPEIEVDEAIRVDDDHCDNLFPMGSYALLSRDMVPRQGDAVVVLKTVIRHGTKRQEVTVREITRMDQQDFMTFRSSNPEYGGSIPVDLTRSVQSNPHEPDQRNHTVRYEIVGVVVYVQVPARVRKL